MVKLKSTCLEDTLKTAGSVKSFDFEFSSDLDCHPQSQDYILSVATDESQLQGKSISNESMCLERHFSSSELVAIGFYRPPEDTGIEIFFQTEHQATLLERYLDECKKFLSAPLEAVKRAFEGYNMPEAEKKIDLQNYGVNSLGIYLICQTMIGAPVAPITHLNLSNCSFDDVGCLAICELLQQSTVLTHLNLSGCPLGPKGGVVLAEGVEISQSLVDLNLSKCMLMDYGCFVIAKALHFHETCKTLDLSYNHLQDAAATELGKVLKQNQVIDKLNLRWNDLFIETICVVPFAKSFKFNENLKELDLSWCGISGKRFSLFFFRALKNHRFLRVLHLEDNRLSEIELPNILKIIKSSTSLEELYLGGNIWSANNIFDLVKTVEGDVTLKLLDLGKFLWVPQNVFILAKQIMDRKSDVKIVFKGQLLPNPPEPVDFKAILVDRAKFLAMAPKKKKLKRNMGHLMIAAKDGERGFYHKESFEDLVKKFKAKLDSNLVGQLGTEFIEKIQVGKRKAKRVAVHAMAEYYLKRHPTARPPPAPPKKKRGRKKTRAPGATKAGKTAD